MFMQPCDWRHLTSIGTGHDARPFVSFPTAATRETGNLADTGPPRCVAVAAFAPTRSSKAASDARTPPQDAARARPDRIRRGGGPAIRERREPRNSATAFRPRVQLRRAGWSDGPRSGDVGPHPEPGDSPGLHRRLDLSHLQWPYPGHGPGRARPEAVPVPSEMARGARRDQVRPDARLQRRAAAPAQAGGRRPGQAGAATRRRCWPPWCGCSSAPRSAWATTSTRNPTARSGSRPCRTATWRSPEPACASSSGARAGRPTGSRSATGGSPASWRDARRVPGADLFQYLDDDGNRVAIGSGDVNDYLREITGEEFTAKDFRTWAGTLQAAAALDAAGPAPSEREAKAAILKAIDQVAERLNNTRAVCRKYYVHPAVLETLRGRHPARSPEQRRAPPGPALPGSATTSRRWSGCSDMSRVDRGPPWADRRGTSIRPPPPVPPPPPPVPPVPPEVTVTVPCITAAPWMVQW